jgi:hypothetical protein
LDSLRGDLERELHVDRAELASIIKKANSSERFARLSALATRLGASTLSSREGLPVSQQELVENIQAALQTKAMIAAVKTSSNYVIVTVIVAVIAFGSMIASWVR